jgi:hypothetical protein
MNIDISYLNKELLGVKIPVPLSGTLSGHAAGEPFDKKAFSLIKSHSPNDTYRQYEFLNYLYVNNPAAVTTNQRWSLITVPALAFLLNRGKDATEKWSLLNQFEEKQNDTADIIIVKDGFYNIIDIKTFNKAKGGQPPNIISAYKLAKMCSLMLKTKTTLSHDITYVGITWEKEGSELKCIDVDIKELFKANPKSLYINWAAALQIQFHPSNLDQDFNGTVEEWCTEYLANFILQAEKRLGKMQKLFIDPFKD